MLTMISVLSVFVLVVFLAVLKSTMIFIDVFMQETKHVTFSGESFVD